MLHTLIACTLIGTGAPERVICCARNATYAEALAAREVRRYVYLRTGWLLPVVEGDPLPGARGAIVVGRKDRAVVLAAAEAQGSRSDVASLASEEYLLRTAKLPACDVVLLAGGDGSSTLYAAYRFAEHLGVRFYLHGDVVPDERRVLELPELDERARPLFDLRGIQPFHDFPEGPDWWDAGDYKAVISQLPKLGMNFIGLHTYPEGKPNAEPTVWIGLPGDAGEDGRVKASYPSSYQNTLRGNWGYSARKTGEFCFGTAELFDRDDHGPDVMAGTCPQPVTPEACNGVFEGAAAMLRDAFEHARRLGVKTCVGTETPLTVPARVKERLQAAGRDPGDPAVLGELYEGIFRRAARAYPLDYYWLWTPEGWTWEGTSSGQVHSTITDLQAAIEAAKKVSAPFQLATCGWVLGPQDDRAMFDRTLPPGMPVSCINREVGNSPVDPAFARVSRRPKWAIPWLEDDPGLTSPQLWVGRMRRDAADARRHGCTGLMGIHWRTRVLSPNVAALARAAWDQDAWNKTPQVALQPPRAEGPIGGQAAAFPQNAIDGTDDDALYQTVRYDVAAYHFQEPDGTYSVTLKFCEPHHGAAGKRVFGVKIQGKEVIPRLDIFGEAGKNKALDYTFGGVEVKGGWLDIDFVKQVEFPSIAAIEIRGAGLSRTINCGGPKYKDYDADWPASAPARGYLPADDFYDDWVLHELGPDAGPAAAAIFKRIDCALPRPSDWVDGPGGLKPDLRPWSEVEKEYGFTVDLANLRPRVKGQGSLERFDYWLSTFRYMKATARVRCLWAEYSKAMEKVAAEKDAKTMSAIAREAALPLREELVRAVAEVHARLLETVSNPGELGTVANWQQHILPGLLEKPAAELEKALGEPLPASAMPSKRYEGPPRVIVPAVRTSLTAGEALRVKAIVLSRSPPREVALHWRPLGRGELTRVPLAHASRGVYSAELRADAAAGEDLEYHVKAVMQDGMSLYFPATAPGVSQTVVVVPAVP